ncbi:ABC transporter ATP-binding protein [Bacillus carboniphilus]|uniref:ABC transporter ATP-binding protein n=1 Tax=Bacillus carboniphilus TaxID=86663 RepID=A0ABY9JY29_9BACI|nr:ABC transporter ATP-binding protein [Bacillus carboniphilus]WLR44304.1 ABC transporter ATP-binding protein [Bacillus carboniphilus]
MEHVSHTFFTKDTFTHVLEDINFTINRGEFISFLGPSGCGKTTLLSIIAQLIKPTNGNVLLEGRNISLKETQIGYMLQQDYLFPWKTIQENILLGLKISKQLSNEKKERTYQLLMDMGLESTINKLPQQLSGGMKQRVALVRTLATDPSLFLLDEPFSAIDFQTKLKLEDLVFTTLKKYQKTMILVTHDIGEAIAMSDRIFLFSTKPGQIKKEVLVNKELSETTPFHARQTSSYKSLFQHLWKEIEQLDN